MLTPDEVLLLRKLLDRAELESRTNGDAIAPGDVVQLRPGASRTWETSLLLVGSVDHRIRGTILQHHRGGCREAWATFSPAEVDRVGRLTFPQPAADIRSSGYCPTCPMQLRKPPASAEADPPSVDQAQAFYRDHRAAVAKQLAAEQIAIAAADNKAAAAKRRKKPCASTSSTTKIRSAP